ncbi:ABC transporter permease [bacterium]|nr:ABC transporter permease [candidate division CSSED10-310 bacterium]
MKNIFLVYQKELKSFFRDKYTLIYSILFPILLYPLIFWGMSQVFTIQRGSFEKMSYRVGFADHRLPNLIYQILGSEDRFDLFPDLILSDVTSAAELKSMDLDVVVQPARCSSDEMEIRLIYDSASDRSSAARDRLEIILNRLKLIELKSGMLESSEDLPDFDIVEFDLSSTEEKSRYLLGILLPMIMVIITVMGALYPAIEVIVSERERQTIESTLSSPISTGHLIAGKFAAVVTMSLVALILNVVSMLVTIKHTLFMHGDLDDLNFTIPLGAVPYIFLGAILIATLFSAIMILVASYAKTFKEAQSFITPIYAIGIQPAVVSALPGIKFNIATALIPITNISLMFRELIRARFDLVPILVTVGSLALWCTIFLLASRYLLRKESIVLGMDRSLFRWRKRRTQREKGGL